MAPVILAYWDIRGLAEPIRMLLSYVGEDWENKMYACGPAPGFDVSSWTDVKYKLGLDLPNLPYLIDDAAGVKVVQSNAILRYVARKHDLCGKTEQEKVRVDIMADQVMDLRNGFIKLCYMSSDFDSDKSGYLAALPAKLKAFEMFLGDRAFFAGAEPTFPDFHMYEMLYAHLKLDPECLRASPKLKAFFERFGQLPKVKAYHASDKFQPLPINNKMAKFGHSVL